MPGLADAYGVLRHPKTQIPVWIDVERTWRETAALRETSPASNDRVLVCFATESVFEIKILLTIAAGLVVRGWEVGTVFPSINSRKSRIYCKAFGSSAVMSLGDFTLTRDEEATVTHNATLLSATEWTIPQLKSYQFGDVWLGPQLIAAVSRRLYSGRVDFRSPQAKSLLREAAQAALASVFRAKKLIRQWHPRLLICMEPNALGTTATVDTAIRNHISVIQVTQPWRDDAFICKRLNAETRRMHPSSVDRRALETCAKAWTSSRDAELDKVLADRYSGKWTLQARNQPKTVDVSQAELQNRFGLEENRKLVVVFSHVLWDANLFYGEDLFEDYGDWFIQTIRAAVENDSVDWLIKLHPANIWKRQHEQVAGALDELRLIAKHIGPLPPHVKLVMPDTRISTSSLYRWADCGVTVRGTAGLEMPCFGKRVITAGTGRYSGLGFTIDPSTPDEYVNELLHISRLTPLDDDETRRARIHAHAALVLKPWVFSGVDTHIATGNKPSHPTDHNISLRLTKREDFLASPDLRQWVNWAITSTEVDLLTDSSEGLE